MDLSKATWRKAAKSGENGGACIEIAGVSDVIVVRDSKDVSGPNLFIDRKEFARFAEALKSL